MNMSIRAETIILLAVAGVGGYLLYKNRNLLNPLSDQNLAYQGVNKITQAFSGDKDATLGTKAFDVVDGAVDSIKDFLPFLESNAERNARLQKEYAERKSGWSYGIPTTNPI